MGCPGFEEIWAWGMNRYSMGFLRQCNSLYDTVMKYFLRLGLKTSVMFFVGN